MTINNEFKFDSMISVIGYPNKEEANKALGKVKHYSQKMAFIPKQLTLNEFSDLILQGHSYCNVFNPKQEEWIDAINYKTKEHYRKKVSAYYNHKTAGVNKGAMNIRFKADNYFKGSQYISIDIDETNYKNIQEFISKLKYLPSLVYTSFSDTPNKRKFRLVYNTNRLMNKEEYFNLSNLIHQQIQKDTNEKIKDKCGYKISQYFNGTNKKECYKFYTVYNVEDLNNDLTEWINRSNGFNSSNKKTEEVCNKSLKRGDKDIQVIMFNEELLNDLKKSTYKEVIKKYNNTYNYFYRVERKDWIEDEKGKYQYTDSSYFDLYYPKSKVMDGQHRRKKLYSNACLRVIMNPNVTPDELLYNLYIDRNKHFDNSDGLLTIKVLVEMVKSAFKKNIDELKKEFKDKIEKAKLNKPLYIVWNYEDKKMIRTVANRVKQCGKTKYDMNELLKYYNPEISQLKNIELFSSYGIKISKRKINELSQLYKSNTSNKKTEEVCNKSLKRGNKDMNVLIENKKKENEIIITNIFKECIRMKSIYNVEQRLKSITDLLQKEVYLECVEDINFLYERIIDRLYNEFMDDRYYLQSIYSNFHSYYKMRKKELMAA